MTTVSLRSFCTSLVQTVAKHTACSDVRFPLVIAPILGSKGRASGKNEANLSFSDARLLPTNFARVAKPLVFPVFTSRLVNSIRSKSTRGI